MCCARAGGPDAGFRGQGLRVSVSAATNREGALDDFDRELKWLVGKDSVAPVCTLIVYPPALFQQAPGAETAPLCLTDGGKPTGDPESNCMGFEGFMSLAGDETDMAQSMNRWHGQDIRSETLIMTFHPNSTFSDIENDPADFALRSPFPGVLILRGTDVRAAEDVCFEQGRQTEDIAIANEMRLRQIGYNELAQQLAAVINTARAGFAPTEVEQAKAAVAEKVAAQKMAAEAAAAAEAVAQVEYDGIDGIEVEATKAWLPDESSDPAAALPRGTGPTVSGASEPKSASSKPTFPA
jgi:hypothetical protein